MLNQTGFDLWADGYDKSVGLSDEENRYPFAGYKRLLGRIYEIVLQKQAPTVLDLGFGTGVLTAKLYEAGCMVYGQDFSPRMIRLAKEKMPKAVLVQGDFSVGLAPALREKTFDVILSTYALHHLDLAGKVNLIRDLMGRLNPGGQLLIGDVAFRSRVELDACRVAAGEDWDEDEIYFVFEEMKAAFPSIWYEQLSDCAGLFLLQSTRVAEATGFSRDGSPLPTAEEVGQDIEGAAPYSLHRQEPEHGYPRAVSGAEDLQLYVPKPEDGWFYVKMMSDPATMAYNALWFPPDGCIPHPEEEWERLCADWIGRGPKRFYAFLRRNSDGSFVGDVNYHYNPDRDWWDMGIVIFAPERGKGYGRRGLGLLTDHAFRVDGIARLHNDFETTRDAAFHIHKAVGFREIVRDNSSIQLELTREEYLNAALGEASRVP